MAEKRGKKEENPRSIYQRSSDFPGFCSFVREFSISRLRMEKISYHWTLFISMSCAAHLRSLLKINEKRRCRQFDGGGGVGKRIRRVGAKRERRMTRTTGLHRKRDPYLSYNLFLVFEARHIIVPQSVSYNNFSGRRPLLPPHHPNPTATTPPRIYPLGLETI